VRSALLARAGHAPALVWASLLAWGAVELGLRIRLMLRPGLRGRMRRWSTLLSTRVREWTFTVIVASLVGAVALAIWASSLGWAAIGARAAAVACGEALIAGGVALRLWAMLTLDRFFTFVVRISDDHRVVTDGPYRIIRHPGYAGALLALAGFGVALANWLSVLILVALPAAAFAVRIRVEETALVSALGQEYREYARRTSGLIPGVW
jgi:protein-S-isoprenylcysteine O-methyltransferase Ste14